MKSELIFTKPSHGRCSHHQIPRGGENLRIAQRLPEFDIEVTPGILPPNQTSHHEAISHPHHYPPYPLPGGHRVAYPARHAVPGGALPALHYLGSQLQFPRGNTAFTGANLTRFSSTCRAPLFYPDWALGQLLYLKRVSGDVFYDCRSWRIAGRSSTGRTTTISGSERSVCWIT